MKEYRYGKSSGDVYKRQAQAYGEAQSANNRLKGQLAEIGTKEFVERTARRDYGYCWYGEIIYQVGNLDEIEQQLEFDVYGQD